MTIPQVKTSLSELMQFVSQLVTDYQNNTISNWGAFAQQVREFFTPSMMEKVERIVPGWGQMAGLANQQTLIHVIGVLTALQLLDEYQQATPEQQNLMQWMCLFHDIAKIPRPEEHDYLHGFRSAAVAGRGLAAAGFPVTASYADLIDGWIALTHNAIIFRDDLQENVQDNRKLPAIIFGVDQLYGRNAPAGLIIRGVLLHISIVTNTDYPIPAPLTDNEIQRYIDDKLFPLFKMMVLADSDGWNLFDGKFRNYHRQETLATFDKISALIG